jgi:hypothetical protein
MTNIKSLQYGIVIALVLAIVYLFGASATRVGASAFPGLITTMGVATTTTVGPQQNKQLFASNSACLSRVVSTSGGSAIMLIFADPTNGDVSSTTLSGSVGHWQAASTTVAYDAGLYGCGRTFAYGYASTTVMTSELR